MEVANEQQAPDQRRNPDSRLKMHLRLLPIGGSTYRIVSLRPSTKVCFSTNFFHQTWHIVSSQQGSRLLARLLWGLSFQTHPDTLLLIHGDHLLPAPFEGERSDPVLLAPAGLTRLNPAALRPLKSRLQRLGPPTRTIRWQTFGLDAALRKDEDGQELWWKDNRELWHQERMERKGGFIVYSAPPPILRQQALIVHRLRVRKGDYLTEMNYHFLAEQTSPRSWCGNGEVQIFADYMDRVAAAVQARHELVANPKEPILSETVQEVVSRQRDQIKARRHSRNRRLI